jgi:hypothetical protein
MQELKPQFRKETWKERFRFRRMGFRVVIYMVEIVIPVFIGALCGHIWGTIAAVLNIIGWLYFGLKANVSFGLRMLWLFALVYVVIVAVVEFAHLFHWQLTSNGHF